MLKDCAGTPDVILIATGSEVGITVEAADKLTAAGRKVRVVSMPSTDAFDKQDAAYRESVLPAAVTARGGGSGYRGLLVQVRGAERRHRGHDHLR
ncbi:hypothetical protein M8494_02980 [Serratia ureilytica]